MKMRAGYNNYIPVFIIVMLLLPLCEIFAVPVKVEKGVLDLRHIEQGKDFSIKMNGEWEFYFERFLEPGARDLDSTCQPDCYGIVPAYWTEYNTTGKRFPGFGYATYRSVILLPSEYHDQMGFEMPVFDTSYELYINGVLVARNGTPGHNKSESVPSYEPLFFRYQPKNDTLELILRVSNFEHRRGGFWLPVKVGTFHKIQSDFTNRWFSSIAITGMLFASFLFFLIFYILDRRNPKLLMFSLVTLGLAIRPFFSAPYLISIINVTNWNLIVRAEYLNLYLLVTSGVWLIYHIYPMRWYRRFAIVVDSLFLVAFIMIITTPVYIFAYAAAPVQVVAIILLLYSLIMSLIGTLKKKWIDMVYLFAIVAMSFGAVSDIMMANGLEENQQIYILSFLMMLFVFIQATLLIREWVRSTHEKEKLHHLLEDMNRNLEKRVKERTRELQQKSDEINAQNNQIALQNKKLSETINLKNKIFSVISHDLRSPVVNILYTLNMLKEEEFRDKVETLSDSCIQYSQMVINLLENMLVWGRGQEEMIRYSPAEYDLADIILTNMSILKESADRKDISLNFTQVGRSKGWFDRDLIDIVVRNLLSNAIKFTNRGGRVTVHVKEREENHEGLIIKVCDNGVGITMDRQKKIFSGDEIDTTPGTEEERGTGIGLKLVHELVTISMGSVSVESSPGSGSCFTVSLPGRNKNSSQKLVF